MSSMSSAKKAIAPATGSFMAALAVQEQEQRARDTAAGLLLPAADMASVLDITPQDLAHAVKARRMFTLAGPAGMQLYPAFFADPGQDRQTLETVSTMLGDLPGAAKWDFFMSPRLSLAKRTPLEALARGKVDAVLQAASAFADE